MRYLLLEDLHEYYKVKEWLIKNQDKRVPGEKLDGKIDAEFDQEQINNALLLYKLEGMEVSKKEAILKIINNIAGKLHIVTDFTIVSEDEKLIKIFSDSVFEVNPEYQIMFQKAEYFKKLENQGMAYFRKLGGDSRNYYEKDGGIYYGVTKKNEEDAHLYGGIIEDSGHLVITSEEYDKVLDGFKNNIENGH